MEEGKGRSIVGVRQRSERVRLRGSDKGERKY